VYWGGHWQTLSMHDPPFQQLGRQSTSARRKRIKKRLFREPRAHTHTKSRRNSFESNLTTIYVHHFNNWIWYCSPLLYPAKLSALPTTNLELWRERPRCCCKILWRLGPRCIVFLLRSDPDPLLSIGYCCENTWGEKKQQNKTKQWCLLSHM
jgi:hypothetical protein